VLGRAGERLTAALRELERIERVIEREMETLRGLTTGAEALQDIARRQHAVIDEINREIKRYNRAREYAKLRYYYLIVTREAVGFRRHKTVEELYCIPPKKKYL